MLPILLGFTGLVAASLEELAPVLDSQVAQTAGGEYAVEDEEGAEDFDRHFAVLQRIVSILILLNLLVRIVVEVQLLGASALVHVKVEREKSVFSFSFILIWVVKLNLPGDPKQLLAISEVESTLLSEKPSVLLGPEGDNLLSTLGLQVVIHDKLERAHA